MPTVGETGIYLIALPGKYIYVSIYINVSIYICVSIYIYMNQEKYI